MDILGISAFYHDSAACLIRDGDVIAAAQEERFSRKKHDARFPGNAIRYCLREGKIDLGGVDITVFYEKPFVKFERLLETYLSFAPRGIWSFALAMPVWIKEKLFLRSTLQKELKKFGMLNELFFTEHHESHAASAFYPSPFEKAAVLCLDGVGEWATTSGWKGEGSKLTPLWEIRFPHSLGLLYSAFTYYTGFKVNSGEYKVMGLAPYGRPKYVQTIYDNLIDLKDDGTFRLNMDYFNYCTGLTMTGRKFHKLFGGPPRRPESKLTQKQMDLARSVQDVTEEVMLRLGKTLYKDTGLKYLCLAGGVALNCVGNGRMLREGPFDDIWIQPASGDAGGALGAALQVWYRYCDKPRKAEGKDFMHGAYLGPEFSNEEIEAYLQKLGVKYHYLKEDELYEKVVGDLIEEKVVGWFGGRMEFGPRALGSRSIVGDARSQKMQSVMNLKIKYRESFRPFAPSVLSERVSEYFELDHPSPYMLLVAKVKKERQVEIKEDKRLWGIELLNVPKSDIPAITHVDYSARVQSVHVDTNPRYHRMIKTFEEKTGYGVVVNTSFNVRGEPIVCTPEDAYRCFMRTEMDTLVLQNHVLYKSEQPDKEEDKSWMQEFDLD